MAHTAEPTVFRSKRESLHPRSSRNWTTVSHRSANSVLRSGSTASTTSWMDANDSSPKASLSESGFAVRCKTPEPSAVSAISPRPRALHVKRLRSRARLLGTATPVNLVKAAATSSSLVGPDASSARATSALRERSAKASKSSGCAGDFILIPGSVNELAYRASLRVYLMPQMPCKLVGESSDS